MKTISRAATEAASRGVPRGMSQASSSHPKRGEVKNPGGRLLALAKALEVLLDDDEVSADEIATYVALNRFADESGRCIPSQTTIGRLVKRSRPWVNERIDRLTAMGYLSKTRRWQEKGGETTCVYRLSHLSAPPVAVATPSCHRGDTPCHEGNTEPDLTLTSTSLSDPQVGASRPVLLHDTWQPCQDDQAWAKAVRPDVDLAVFICKFIAKVNASGGVCGDPADRWRQWLVDERPPASRPPKATAKAGKGLGKNPVSPRQPSPDAASPPPALRPIPPAPVAHVSTAPPSLPAPIAVAARMARKWSHRQLFEIESGQALRIKNTMDTAATMLPTLFEPTPMGAIEAFLRTFAERKAFPLPKDLAMDVAAIAESIPADLFPIACQRLWTAFGYRRLPEPPDFLKAVNIELSNRQEAAANIKSMQTKLDVWKKLHGDRK